MNRRSKNLTISIKSKQNQFITRPSQQFSDANLFKKSSHPDLRRCDLVKIRSKSPMLFSRKIESLDTFSLEKAIKLSNFIKTYRMAMTKKRTSKIEKVIQAKQNKSTEMNFQKYVQTANPQKPLQKISRDIKSGKQQQKGRRGLGKRNKYTSEINLTEFSPWRDQHENQYSNFSNNFDI